MTNHPLLRFTPSALPAADLEAILVKREPLAAETVELVHGFANGDGPPMRLFVGPRGMGKTHLVAVIANRLTADSSLTGRMQVAWLDEDPYRIRNYTTFLAEIQRSLTGDRVAPHGLANDALEEWLTQRAAEAPIVIVVENLDAVFERIGHDGQHRLRSLIENTRRMGFVATATSRFDDLADAQLPFYGMFEVTELEPFTLDEATELVRRIASRSGDQQLLDFLKRPQSRQRLKVVQHLTGGHPRIWLLLASSLSIEALDEVIPIFMGSLDQLTPYYQSRIHEVSPDQQAIVMALIDAEGAVAVKEIAALVQVDERAAASQLGQLVRKGYVRVAAEPSVASSGDARRSYYELREPLMRLNLKVKEARGAPLEVVVAFLRAWFGARLLDRPEAQGIGGPMGIAYVRHAIGPELLDDATFMLGTTDELRARGLYAAQLYPDRVEPVLALARSEHLTDNVEAALARLDQHLASNPTPTDRSRLLAERGNALQSDQRWTEALERCIVAWGEQSQTFGAQTEWLIGALAVDLVRGRLIDDLVVAYSSAEALEQLGNAIVASLVTVLPQLAREELADWQRQWRSAGADHGALEVPLILMAAGIAWWTDRDRAHLLALPQELRSVLEDVLAKAAARVPLPEGRPKVRPGRPRKR